MRHLTLVRKLLIHIKTKNKFRTIKYLWKHPKTEKSSASCANRHIILREPRHNNLAANCPQFSLQRVPSAVGREEGRNVGCVGAFG